MDLRTEDKPPYVTFEYRAVEDRAKEISKGHYATKDVAFANVTRPGSKDTLEVNAEDWLNGLSLRAKQGLVPPSWADGFASMFEKWKSGEEAPVSGTSIKGSPLYGPSAQKTLIAAGFRTNEDLASAGDAEISGIGTGAMELRNKARTWVEQSTSIGTVVAKMTALETQLADLIRINQEQEAALKAYRAADSEKKAAK